jgi:hypothetical protein
MNFEIGLRARRDCRGPRHRTVATLLKQAAVHDALELYDLAASLPPFQIAYDLKLRGHRRFDNDPRGCWLREQLTPIFNRRQWLTPPPGPGPFYQDPSL